MCVVRRVNHNVSISPLIASGFLGRILLLSSTEIFDHFPKPVSSQRSSVQLLVRCPRKRRFRRKTTRFPVISFFLRDQSKNFIIVMSLSSGLVFLSQNRYIVVGEVLLLGSSVIHVGGFQGLITLLNLRFLYTPFLFDAYLYLYL